jgi:hypothetical protein
LGTPVDDEDCEGACARGGVCEALGSLRRELKEDMNSIEAGDSPSRLLKCSAASCFERVAA